MHPLNRNSTILLNDGASSLQVEVITFAYLCSGLLSSFPIIGPAFDTALQDIKITYPNLNFTHRIVGNRAGDCSVANLLDGYEAILAEFYFNAERQITNVKRFDLTVFVSPGSPGDGLGVARLAAEEKKLLITSVTGISSYYPNWITTSVVSIPVYARVYENMARLFNWTDITILVDIQISTNIFYKLAADYTRERLESSRDVRITQLEFDSLSYRAEDYAILLRNISGISRVVLYFVSGTPYGLQSAMDRLQMTNGEYIFVGIMPFRPTTLMSPARPVNDGNSSTDVPKLAAKSFILIENPPASDANVTRLQAQWREMSRIKYNYTYPATSLVPPYLASTYAAMMTLAKVTDDIRRTGSRVVLTNGQHLVHMFANQTFLLKTGKVKFNQRGECVPYVAVTQTDSIMGKVSVIMQQDAETDQLVMISPVDWPSVWPVPNEPKCGFKGNSVICLKTDYYAIACGASLGTVGTLLVLCSLLSNYLTRYRNWGHTWWNLEGMRLIPADQRTMREKTYVHFNPLPLS